MSQKTHTPETLNDDLSLIHTISLPRSLSTIFEIALASSLCGVQINEPINGINKNTTNLDEHIQLARTNHEEGANDYELRIITKILAVSLEPNVLEEIAAGAKAFFLTIRDPRKQVSSYFEAKKRECLALGYSEVAASDAALGFIAEADFKRTSWREMQVHYDWLDQRFAGPIGIVDSLEFSRNPEGTMYGCLDIMGLSHEFNLAGRGLLGQQFDFVNANPVASRANADASIWIGKAVESKRVEEDNRSIDAYMELPKPAVEFIDNVALPIYCRLLETPYVIRPDDHEQV